MHAGKGNFLGKDDCDSTLFINILYGRQGSLYNTEHMLCVRRELLEGQDLHMEAKETEELLDWIAAEAGLDEVSLYTYTVPAWSWSWSCSAESWSCSVSMQ